MKKLFIIVAVIYGGYYYVSSHYQLHDALVYAQKHPDASLAPKIDYYVGFYYYQQSQYQQSQEAFTQLLLDYPTCQYEPTALYYLGDSAEQNGNWDLAKSSLARYIDHFPNGQDKETVAKKLELLKYHHGMDIPDFPSREQPQ